MASGDSLHLSEPRVVLLGWRGAGKSSSGNTILGREEFDLRIPAQCVKKQGEVAGRQLTVIDTPGWWMNYPLENYTELVKQEIVRSVSLCPPGPHTLLLVIDVDLSFTEKNRRSVEEHLQLLGDRVWSHTIVLFTCGDSLGDKTIEQHIETKGKNLQWLVEKCGNRYHVLNNKNRADGTQVTELLDKMEEMVAANSGDVFYPEIDGREEMNWSGVEKVQKQALRSLDLPPLMSGESRAESGWASEQPSEAGSVSGSLRPKKRGGGRFDVLSQGSSGYVSQTPRSDPDHTSEKETKRSPHIGLNPEAAHSWTSTPQGPTPTIVVPELCSYRLQCPHAGLFQCSLTGLRFQMEGEGEVLYSAVQWDEDLLFSRGQTPAGPLFSIDCPQGSVCQLHLPHCEILTGEGLGSLSVAHVSGDSVELLPPLRVTDTHVVVKVTDLSLWGLVRRYIPSIRGQVLPFLRSLGSQRSVLNLVVAPANVLLEKVKEQHRTSTYISASQYCTLTRGKAYGLCCDEVERDDIQPECVKVHWSYSPNYDPSFQVFLSSDTEEVKLRLLKKDGGEQVWAADIPLPGAWSMGGRESGSAEERLRSARWDLTARVSEPVLGRVLDRLLQEKVIDEEERDSVMGRPGRAETAWAIVNVVLGKGDESCSVMMDLLHHLDPCLHSELGF